MTSTAPPGSPREGRAVVVYSLLRVGLFVVCLAVCAALPLPRVAVLVVAVAASGLLSWFLLGRQRAAMSAAIEARIARRRR